MIETGYQPLAVSDHFGLVMKIKLCNSLAKILSPKCSFQFRLTSEVIKDKLFQERLEVAMVSWQRFKVLFDQNMNRYIKRMD